MKHKWANGLFSIVASIVLTATSLPLSVFAAPEKTYDLWVAGVQFTENNLVINSEDNPAIQGSATLSVAKTKTGADAFTLTLDDFSNGMLYKEDVEDDGTLTRYAVKSYADMLNVVLKGENTLSVDATTAPIDARAQAAFAIWNGAAIHITGEQDASLLASAISGSNSIAICSSPGTGDSAGLTIKGTTVTAFAESKNYAAGLYASGGKTTIDGGTVKAKAINQAGAKRYICHGIFSDTNTVIKNGATVDLFGSTRAVDWKAPVLTGYGGTYISKASKDLAQFEEYNPDKFESYKSLKIEPVKYDLWVAGIQMNSANLTIDAQDNPKIKGSATLSVDASGKKPVYHLQLNNFDNASLSHSTEFFSTGIYADNGDLNLSVSGNNRITSADTTNQDSIAVYGMGNLTITGEKDAVLHLLSGSAGTWSCALNSLSDLTIKDLTLNLSTTVDQWTNAIFISRGDLFIDGATIVAEAAESTENESHGIEIDPSRKIVLKNSASVTTSGHTFATSSPLDFSDYGKAYVILASKNIDGSDPVTYVPEDTTTYKYLQISPESNPKPDEGGGKPSVDPKPDEGESKPSENPKPDEGESKPSVDPKPDEEVSKPSENPKPDEEVSKPSQDQRPSSDKKPSIHVSKPNPTVEQPEPTTEYEILDGADEVYEPNSDGSLSIRGSGAFSDFSGVKVDGTLISPNNYTVTEGSTIITLKPEYLNTLSPGSHSVELIWTSGSASTSIKVKENDTLSIQSDNTTTESEHKGSTVAVWPFLLIVILGIGALFLYFKVKGRESEEYTDEP